MLSWLLSPARACLVGGPAFCRSARVHQTRADCATEEQNANPEEEGKRRGRGNELIERLGSE
jgi:hypothetical protein